MSGTGPKAKRNTFGVALDSALKRYAKATKEREACVRKLDALNLEIPQLQETIKVLQKQTGKEVMPFAIPATGESPTGVYRVDEVKGQNGNFFPVLTPIPGGVDNGVPTTIPPEVAKHLVLDLSGMGSVPASQTTEEPKSADTAPDTK
jgi:monomeric isocitrate dehydrogenase